jgi:hypothetical protein
MSSAKLFVLAALVAMGSVACSAAQGDGSEVLESTADELATTGPTYQAGTTLRTTANLNLRSAGSINANILRVMPSGSNVTVRVASGANAWVAVRFNGYDGWAHTSYLTPVNNGGGGGGGNPGGYSATRGGKLASTALRMDGHAAGGWCALETSNSVEKSGIIPNGVTWYRNNAIDISEYMASNAGYDAKVGFKSISVSPNDIPKGSIIGWRRGQCGYSSKYGHIEISVDSSSSRACSDFCGYIKKSCGSPYVFMPTTL